MIDGQELNELFYACTFTGNHYSVSNIKKIEIIRGPGSAIYGGSAELGVINIITKSGSDLNGFEVGIDYGQMSETYSHKNLTLSVGKKIDEFEFAIHAFYGEGNRSERDNVDRNGDTFNMAGQSDINPMNFNASANYKDFSARIIYDKYVTTSRDYFGVNLAKAYQIDYESILGEIKYDWKIFDNLTLTPKVNVFSSIPWHSIDTPITEDEGSKLNFDKSAIRSKFNLTSSYDYNKNINIIAGIEYYQDNAKHMQGFSHNSFWNGKNEITYSNIAGFAQGIIRTDFVNMTIGGRVDKHSQYGAAFAPRIAFTKVINNLHLKLLFSQAFRSPSIDEIDLNYYLPPTKVEPEITPEKASIFEFEVGYQITRDMSFVAGTFYNKIENSIVFTYSDEGGEGGEGYDNRGSSGSKGFEFEYRLRKEWGYLTLNYSYYSSGGKTAEIDYYRAIGHEGVLLGTSPHKIAFNSSFKIYKDLTINPSFVYLGDRYGYALYDSVLDEMVLSKYDPLLLLNLFVNYRNVLTEGLNVGIGAYNIADAEYSLIQGYNGAHPPLPEQGRRLVFKMSYNFDFE